MNIKFFKITVYINMAWFSNNFLMYKRSFFIKGISLVSKLKFEF